MNPLEIDPLKNLRDAASLKYKKIKVFTDKAT